MRKMDEIQPLRVAIIGAGLTGLLIAQGLRKVGDPEHNLVHLTDHLGN